MTLSAKNSALSAKEAVQRELASRELARRSLIALVMRHEPTYHAGWLHKDIAARLEQFSRDVVEQKSPRLILSVPPRHGKSTLGSLYFPAWHIGHNPKHEVIITSHTATLAERFSKRCREVMLSPVYRPVFPDAKLHPDIRSVQNWQTTKGGGLLAAGVGGAILGSGAHLLVIDDPVKNAEEAQSESVQEAIYDWFFSTAYTRLAPGGGVLVIMQRWADNDLSGVLLEKMKEGGDRYELVRYPAIAEVDEEHRKQGEALHPERYSLEMLKSIEANLDPWMWNALYQQRPTIEDGDYFKKEMITYYDDKDVPEHVTNYATWDLAISKRDKADWTVGLTASVTDRGEILLRDRVRDRMDAFEIVDAMIENHLTWQTELDGIEDGQIRLAIGPYLENQLDARSVHTFNAEPLKVGRKDKVARARPAQGLLRRGKIKFPKHAPWVKGFVAELMAFPNGVHDDQVDALSHLAQMVNELDNVKAGRVPKDDSPEQEKRGWRSRLNEVLGKRRVRDWRAV